MLNELSAPTFPFIERGKVVLTEHTESGPYVNVLTAQVGIKQGADLISKLKWTISPGLSHLRPSSPPF